MHSLQQQKSCQLYFTYVQVITKSCSYHLLLLNTKCYKHLKHENGNFMLSPAAAAGTNCLASNHSNCIEFEIFKSNCYNQRWIYDGWMRPKKEKTHVAVNQDVAFIYLEILISLLWYKEFQVLTTKKNNSFVLITNNYRNLYRFSTLLSVF